MERVKPIYLSRTYNVPLPNPDDPSESWDPEDLLDKLARMKGRLLKHGEPDREAIAKIMLSDWVRGRIPFFVVPPVRSEELNAAEEKMKKLADIKGKSKAVEEPELVPMKQNLKTVMQKNTFVPEDIQPLDEPSEDGEESESEADGASEDEAVSAEEEDEEDDLKWGDIFEGVSVPAEPSDSGDSGENEAAAGGDEGESR
jgi:nuclear GTP-binding protein